MTVFLCWSHSGKAYAEALGNFLRSCFPKGVAVKISTGLSKGGNWSDELLRQLKEANFGVMCLTPDSDSAWMCYEAGVLDSGGAPVAPLLFSVSRAFAPLSQKQVTAFAKDDVCQRHQVGAVDGAVGVDVAAHAAVEGDDAVALGIVELQHDILVSSV